MGRIKKIAITAILMVIVIVTVYFNRQFKSFISLDMAHPKKASMVQNRVLADDGVGVFFYDHKGEKTEISSLGPYPYGGTKNLAFIVEGETLSLYDTKGRRQKEIILDQPIFNLEAHEDTATLSNNLFQMTIDERGNVLSQVEEDDGFMVFSAISKSKKYTSYTSLREEEGRVVSILTLMDGKEILFRHELVDQIILHIEFIGEKLLVATNTNVYLFNGERIQSQIFVSNLSSIGATKDRIFVLEKEKLSVYDLDFILKDRQMLSKEDLRIKTNKNKCYLYNSDEIFKYDTNLLTPISVDGEIVKLLKFKNHLYIVYNSGIEYLD